jgi:RHS repeat-associated protein
VRFDRITPGTGVEDAVLEATSTPGPYFKARMAWDGVRKAWRLTRRDGTVMLFGLSGSKSSLREVADRFGNRLVLMGTAGTSPQPATQMLSWPSGRWINLTYTSGRATQAADNFGRTVTYTYDGSGRLTSVTDANQTGQPSPLSTTYGWATDSDCSSPSSVLTSITDPRGITFLSNTYGSACRVTQQTVATATGTDVWTLAYTPSGPGTVTQTDVTDPNGTVHRASFDSSGYMTSETFALGTPEARAFTYERDSANHRTNATVDAFHSRRTEYTYSSFGQPISVTRLAGTADAVTTSYTYEPVFRQLKTITDPLNHTTTILYDADGCIDSLTDAANRTTSFNCNGAGQITEVTDPLSHTTQYAYAHGDMTSVTDALGRATVRFTDGAGRVLEVTDPLNHATGYQYDKLNQLTRITDAIGGLVSFTFDPDGNLLEVNDERRGSPSLTTFVYNNLNLPSSRTDPLGRPESFTYDDMGNLTLWTDRKNQATEFRYDPLDRLTFAGFNKTGPSTFESQITYTWDVGGRLTQIADTTAGAGTITRGYDDLERLTSEGVNTYGYDAAGRRTSMTVSGQQQVTYGYNNADQLTSVTKGTTSVALGYDQAGRAETITFPTSPQLVQTFAYSNANDVTSITYQRGTDPADDLAYVYDPAGLRTAVHGSFARTGLPAATTSNAVYDLANRLTSWNGQAVTSDNNGNLTAEGGITYSYNAGNQLSSAVQGETTLATFVYDGLGRRVEKVLSGTTTKFVHDGWNVVQEKDAQGQVSANLLTGLGLDDIFLRTDADQSVFLSDALGSTVALGDTAGVVQTSYTYEPFGQATVTGTSNSNSYQFTGRENDSAGSFNVLSLRARSYSPSLGRFLSEDPISFAGGDINLYAYSLDAPTMASDPLGLLIPTGSTGSGAEVSDSRKDISSLLLAPCSTPDISFDPATLRFGGTLGAPCLVLTPGGAARQPQSYVCLPALGASPFCVTGTTLSGGDIEDWLSRYEKAAEGGNVHPFELPGGPCRASKARCAAVIAVAVIVLIGIVACSATGCELEGSHPSEPPDLGG